MRRQVEAKKQRWELEWDTEWPGQKQEKEKRIRWNKASWEEKGAISEAKRKIRGLRIRMVNNKTVMDIIFQRRRGCK